MIFVNSLVALISHGFRFTRMFPDANRFIIVSRRHRICFAFLLVYSLFNIIFLYSMSCFSRAYEIFTGLRRRMATARLGVMRPPRSCALIFLCAFSMATAPTNATAHRRAGTVKSTPPPEDKGNYTAKYYDKNIYFNIYEGRNSTPRRRTLWEIISKFSTSEMLSLKRVKAFVPVDDNPTTTLEDIADILNYAVCDDNSCGCTIETQAR
uniref:Glycoprotein 105 n=3 Tax=Human betaherpesvirus 6A TaxID=32603 RepID=A0A2L2QBY3_9BETA|nr:Glycoprotein 105 [Human betaherpesvirus 6A]AVI07666.1 Glycoprotein 105 [Human betaherpesvirus 6A]AVI07788.1 Glycoprotein 105 [Human betaherpesvirus 6A]AVI07909.1 Glycoprotein 105 [Human betaherpesvirus 6A]AVI08290.1 Glycoprotein 105 [Human betaherpesvirus 6A]